MVSGTIFCSIAAAEEFFLRSQFLFGQARRGFIIRRQITINTVTERRG